MAVPCTGRPPRCDDTKDCIIQFYPPDDEHLCSKHVEAWNILTIKFSASSWLILLQNMWIYGTAKGDRGVPLLRTTRPYPRNVPLFWPPFMDCSTLKMQPLPFVQPPGQLVGTATRYGLDVVGIESRWGWVFLHPPRPAVGSTHSPAQCTPSLFPGSKEADVWRQPPTPTYRQSFLPLCAFMSWSSLNYTFYFNLYPSLKRRFLMTTWQCVTALKTRVLYYGVKRK